MNWLPFFNLQSGDDGVIVAIGWTGQWYARIDRDDRATRLQAGMEGLSLSLRPGETIRTPRILLLYWRGRPLDGQNQLRRLLLTTCSTASDAWIALQLHRPDQNAGVILAFRRAASPMNSADFRLSGILPTAQYSFEDADSGAPWTVAGQVLAAKGLSFTIPQPRSSRCGYA